MKSHFNFDPAPSVAERAKRRPPFERMTKAKAMIVHISGAVRSHLDALSKAVDPDPKLACAVEVDAASRIAASLKADVADIDRWIAQYTEALSEQVGGQKIECKQKRSAKYETENAEDEA